MKKLFLRARKPEEKELRSQHLLATAKALLEQGTDLKQLSLNELARSAGMAKANVYRYFETREALLLELLWTEWQDWYADFQRKCAKKSSGVADLEGLISILASTIAGRALLCSLTAVLPSVLETNLSEDRLHQFKLSSLNFFGEIAEQLQNYCPELTSKNFTLLLHDTVTFMVGLHPFVFPNQTVKKVLSNPELKFYRRDFRVDLERYMNAVANSLRER